MALFNRLSPGATDLVRLDHMHVRAAFRQYRPGLPERLKKGLADHICLALEIHARVEEEIFYPALRAVWDTEVIRKSRPEHDEIRGLVTRLRYMPAGDPLFEASFLDLMRQVLHHVADEEALVLPAADRLLAGQLGELGARMNRRRLQLAAARTPELASSLWRALSPQTVLAGVASLVAGAQMLARPVPACSAGGPDPDAAWAAGPDAMRTPADGGAVAAGEGPGPGFSPRTADAAGAPG